MTGSLLISAACSQWQFDLSCLGWPRVQNCAPSRGVGLPALEGTVSNARLSMGSIAMNQHQGSAGNLNWPTWAQSRFG